MRQRGVACEQFAKERKRHAGIINGFVPAKLHGFGKAGGVVIADFVVPCGIALRQHANSALGGGGDGGVVCFALADVLEFQAAVWVFADDLTPCFPCGHGLVVDGDDLVVFLQACALRGGVGAHFADAVADFDGRDAQANFAFGDIVGLLRACCADNAGFRLPLRVFHLHVDFACFQIQHDFGVGIGKIVYGLAVYADDFVALLKACLGGDAGGLYRAHIRANLGDAAHAKAKPIQ